MTESPAANVFSFQSELECLRTLDGRVRVTLESGVEFGGSEKMNHESYLLVHC